MRGVASFRYFGGKVSKIFRNEQKKRQNIVLVGFVNIVVNILSALSVVVVCGFHVAIHKSNG